MLPPLSPSLHPAHLFQRLRTAHLFWFWVQISPPLADPKGKRTREDRLKVSKWRQRGSGDRLACLFGFLRLNRIPVVGTWFMFRLGARDDISWSVSCLVWYSGDSRSLLPRWLNGKEPACHYSRCKRHRFDPWVGKIPWRRKWQPTPIFLPGKSHGQRSLVGYSPWACRVGITEQLNNNDNVHCNIFLQMPRYGNNLHAHGRWMDEEDTYINDGILFSHKKNEILSFVTIWMDLEGIMLSE